MADSKDRQGRGWFIQLNYDAMTQEKHAKGEKGKPRNPFPEKFDHVPSEKEWRSYLPTWVTDKLGTSWKLIGTYHDSDRVDNGDLKPLHVHFVGYAKNSTKQDTIMKKLGITRFENCQSVKSYQKCAKYLLHINDKNIADGKFIYSQDALFGAGCFLGDANRADMLEQWFTWAKGKGDGSKNNKEDASKFLDKINGAIGRGLLRSRDAKQVLENEYGDSGDTIFARNFKNFETLQRQTMWEKADDFTRNKRLLFNNYVFGEGGLGKTGLAEAMAKPLCPNRLIHKPEAPQAGITYDPQGTYQGERASVLNDARGGMFGFNAFNTLFDDTTFTPAGSRQKAMPWTINYSFFSSSESWEQYVYETLVYQKGAKKLYNLKQFDEVSNDAFNLNPDDWQFRHNRLLQTSKQYQKDVWQMVRRMPTVMHVYRTPKQFNGYIDFHNISDFEKLAPHTMPFLQRQKMNAELAVYQQAYDDAVLARADFVKNNPIIDYKPLYSDLSGTQSWQRNEPILSTIDTYSNITDILEYLGASSTDTKGSFKYFQTSDGRILVVQFRELMQRVYNAYKTLTNFKTAVKNAVVTYGTSDFLDKPLVVIDRLNFKTHQYEHALAISIPSVPVTRQKLDRSYDDELDRIGIMLDNWLGYGVVDEVNFDFGDDKEKAKTQQKARNSALHAKILELADAVYSYDTSGIKSTVTHFDDFIKWRDKPDSEKANDKNFALFSAVLSKITRWKR